MKVLNSVLVLAGLMIWHRVGNGAKPARGFDDKG